LNIIKIIGETSTTGIAARGARHRLLRVPGAAAAELSIPTSPEFGFTIGANSAVLSCIADINSLRGTSKLDLEFNEKLQSILSRLNTCRRALKNVNNTVIPDDTHSQAMAFVLATYIYLYRAVFNLSPARLKHYVSGVFEQVTLFFANSNGNFSIWPAFVAAVEAYTVADMDVARAWLQRSTAFGMGNRYAMRKVVEAVWHRRSREAFIRGFDPGDVVVDWVTVMQELDIDILLV
jgi:hypothetical protein